MDLILLDAIKNNGGGIKSVQRGSVSADWTGDGNVVEIPIGTVNPAKCFVSVRASMEHSSGSYSYRDVVLYNITVSANAVSIKLGNPGMSSYHIPIFIEWQLIEFV